MLASVRSEEPLVERLRASVQHLGDLAWSLTCDAVAHLIEPDPALAEAARDTRRQCEAVHAACAEVVGEALGDLDLQREERGELLDLLGVAADLLVVADLAAALIHQTVGLPDEALPGELVDLAHAAVDDLARATVALREGDPEQASGLPEASVRRARLESTLAAVGAWPGADPAPLVAAGRQLDAVYAEAGRLGRGVRPARGE